jgi:hypothetical protein
VILTTEEIAGIKMSASRLSVDEVVGQLQVFLSRERALFELMPEDAEQKMVMLHGMACLVAAAAMLMPNQDQTTSSGPGTPPG